MTPASPCIVCGSPRHQPLYRVLRRCEECGMVFAPLDLTPEELQRLYDEGYFKGEEYSDYVKDRPFLEKNFRLRLKTLERFLTPSHTRCLEIGCAYGFFLSVAAQRFAHAEGVDLSQPAVRHARETLGLNAREGDFLQLPFEGKFDVICMWDTIEHLAHPDQYLERAVELLNPGGLICVTTGDIASAVARRRREKWRMIHPPTHLFYFSQDTLGRLFRRLGCEVVHSRSCGFYRSIDNVLYNIFALRWKKPGLYKSGGAIFRLLGLKGFYFNAGDIMYLIARKPE